MKQAALIVLALAGGCTTARPEKSVGWTVDPTYRAPTSVQMFLYGPAADVEGVIADSRPFGWRPVERALLPSGSAFALLEGPVDFRKGGNLDEIVGARPVTLGPAITLDRRPWATPR